MSKKTLTVEATNPALPIDALARSAISFERLDIQRGSAPNEGMLRDSSAARRDLQFPDLRNLLALLDTLWRHLRTDILTSQAYCNFSNSPFVLSIVSTS